MSEPPRILLEHRLKALKLPTFLREYEKVRASRRKRAWTTSGSSRAWSSSSSSTASGASLSDASRRRSSPRQEPRQLRVQGHPSVNKAQVLELARCEWIERRENVIALGPSGTGKSHVAQGLGLAACQQGMSVASSPPRRSCTSS